MNKVELTAALARHTGITKVDAEVMVNATFKIIADRLATGDKVRIDDFGTFEVKNRAPKAGVPVKIPACRAPSFKAHKTLKDSINRSK